MIVIDSTYKVDAHYQKNGKRYVTEFHTTDTGEVLRIEYGPMDDKTDYEAIILARATMLNNQLAEQEVQAAQEVKRQRIAILLENFSDLYVKSDDKQALKMHAALTDVVEAKSK